MPFRSSRNDLLMQPRDVIYFFLLDRGGIAGHPRDFPKPVNHDPRARIPVAIHV